MTVLVRGTSRALGRCDGVYLWLCSRAKGLSHCVEEQMDSVPFAGEGDP